MKKNKKSRRKKKTAEEIARHEAGHAIVALAMGYAVLGASIDEASESGVTHTAWLSKHEDPLCAGIVAWAGAAAEGVRYLIESGDHRVIRRHRFTERSSSSLLAAAEHYVAQYRPAIDAVAAELVRRGSVSGATIKRVAFRACPELRREAMPTPRWLTKHMKANAC